MLLMYPVYVFAMLVLLEMVNLVDQIPIPMDSLILPYPALIYIAMPITVQVSPILVKRMPMVTVSAIVVMMTLTMTV